MKELWGKEGSFWMKGNGRVSVRKRKEFLFSQAGIFILQENKMNSLKKLTQFSLKKEFEILKAHSYSERSERTWGEIEGFRVWVRIRKIKGVSICVICV